MNCVRQRLHERTFQKGKFGRQLEEALSWNRDILGQAAMKIQAIESSTRTDVFALALTKPAMGTSNQWVDRSSVSWFEIGDLVSDLGNLTAELVAEYKGRNALLAFSEESMQVRATNSNRTDLHQCFIRPDRRNGNFLKLESAWGSVNEGFQISVMSKG
jgi:hypothetical protein